MTVIPETLCEHQICFLRFYWRCYRGNQEQRIEKWTESTKQKVQTMIYKTLHIKQKIRKNKPNKLTGVNTGGSCSTSGTCPVLLLRLKITKLNAS